MKLENKPTVVLFSIIITSYVPDTLGSADVKYFSCLSCSGIDFRPNSPDLECLNDTESITTVIHCNSSWPCTYGEQIDQRTNEVKSVLRGCQPYNSMGTECIPSIPNKDCLQFCFSDRCNNDTNRWTKKNDHNGSESFVSNIFLFVTFPLLAFLILFPV